MLMVADTLFDSPLAEMEVPCRPAKDVSVDTDTSKPSPIEEIISSIAESNALSFLHSVWPKISCTGSPVLTLKAVPSLVDSFVSIT